MTIGGSLILIALGAILQFAITASVAGVDIDAVGAILLVIGGIGLVIGLIQWASAERHGGPPQEPYTRY